MYMILMGILELILGSIAFFSYSEHMGQAILHSSIFLFFGIFTILRGRNLMFVNKKIKNKEINKKEIKNNNIDELINIVVTIAFIILAFLFFKDPNIIFNK